MLAITLICLAVVWPAAIRAKGRYTSVAGSTVVFALIGITCYLGQSHPLVTLLWICVAMIGGTFLLAISTVIVTILKERPKEEPQCTKR